MANLTLTYVLWLFGGIFGLHHLYLNRPRHCFIWCVTWGGMFIGWLDDTQKAITKAHHEHVVLRVLELSSDNHVVDRQTDRPT
ncbi:hypothetical protein DPMN_184141 [Dreissena polymorpha]|uniref:TM2 domain-containing protein n=1 Tax=Dreissena polymorpha TaxID=45954 RepID=A0A9D4DJF8_DREPO|nr:hypothetical protein DPMN_184141 [Dreissena polymorpha]